MRVLFATNAHLGHLHPLVPTARALRDAGHSVRVTSEPAFAAVIGRLGFDAVGVGRDLDVNDVLGALPEIFTVPAEAQNA